MNTPRRLAQATARQGLFLFGWLNFALGTLGLFLPVMHTTVFWIMAAWAWGRSCPRLQQRIYRTPHIGPHVQVWMEKGRITRRGRRFALGGMGLGLVSVSLALHDRPLIWLLAGLPLLAAMVYVATRPEWHGPEAQAQKFPDLLEKSQHEPS